MPTAQLSRGPVAAALALAAGLLAACVNTPAPNEQLGISRTAIEAAQAAGANDAAPEMALARDKLARAEVAARANDTVTARRLAEQAAIDAQVARSKIEADKASKAAAEIDASLAALRDEMTRNSPAMTSPVKP